ncbi:hypothetical protein [Priestia endophytica]|uniref:hypothetical protein n=1 Tax=Priestia endophytica TaxID=135735 RepID=UPI0022829791|nr:hypothetical protein [Priestia endophytica]MCY8234914.1 hypothetical protein [Priestia endophytica]
MSTIKDVLHKTLLEKGVPESHILDMQATLNVNEYPYEYYYEEIMEEEDNYEHVPLSKIKSLGFRGTEGISWFDHACYNGTHNIDESRCQKAFEHLKKESIEEFQEYYKSSFVELIYFIDDDFYAVYGDGTHRTLWAKVTGASTIYARVTRAKKNSIAYEVHQKFKSLEKEFYSYLKSKKLEWTEPRYLSSDINTVSEIIYKGHFLWVYPMYSPKKFRSKDSCDPKIIMNWKKQQEDFRNKLALILRYKKKLHTIIKLTPRKWETKCISFLEKWSKHWLFSDEQVELKKVGFDMFCIDRKHMS